MIDLHCHILPGVDDGSYSMEESVRMARMASESGVTDIVVTPHCNVPDNPAPIWRADVYRSVRQLQEVLDRKLVPLKVYPGMEIYGLPDVPELLERGELITLNGSRYPLVEFPFRHYAGQAVRLLERLLCMGYRPVVAHPERYRYVQENPELLNLLVDMGCLLQVNRGSFLGRFGPEAEETVYAMLERGFITAISSDAHRSTVRTPGMRDVWQIVCRECSERTAHLLLHDRAEQIIRDEPIKLEEPDWF